MEKFRYKLGLDLGITSVGWAVVELDKNDEPFRIVDMDSRIFDRAEVPKTGASLALPRREARSARRRLRRHRHRLERIKDLFFKKAIITEQEFENLYIGKIEDIYKIRCEALDRKLSQEEFVRLLIHFAQRRGFKSNRKADKEGDAGKLLTATAENKKRLEENNYRTIGEMFFKDKKFAECKRNKAENYSNTVLRSMVEDEIKLIFDLQRKYGFGLATEELENSYLDIFSSQRPFDLGPGGDSPYGGNQIEKMIGKCTFEKDEPRAPKASYSFERCTLLQKVNSIKIKDAQSERQLTKEERQKIIALAHKSENITYKRIRKELDLDVSYIFNISYGYNDKEEIEEKTKLNYLKAYHTMRKVFDKLGKDRIKNISTNERNEIAYAFTVFKNDEKIEEQLQNKGIIKEYRELLIENLSAFDKVGHLSVKACDNLIPFLEEGLIYNEACEKAGYDFRGHANVEKNMYLKPLRHDQNEITNPVVLRSISQSIKVVNAVIRKYGSPTLLGIELAREMSKNFKDRGQIEKEQKENASKNEQIIQELKDTYKVQNPTGIDIVRLKLWREQDGICLYSLKSIPAERIFEKGYCDIDHIVPYSISFDDGYRNKVLVLADENRQKGNGLPLEYLQGKRKDDYIVYIKTNIKNQAKKSRLLKEKITEEDVENFRERNLTDTQFLAKFMANYINDSLLFAENQTAKKRVVTPVNGALTAFMRKRWGITKIREDGDLHHAVDALVVACITQGIIHRVTRYYKFKETLYEEHVDSNTGEILDINKKTGEVAKGFPLPFENFRDAIEEKLQTAFVSRMPRHKVTGQAHLETIRSPKLIEKGLVVAKTELTSLKLDKDGEIEGYYNPESDRLLYNALKNRLHAFNGDAKKAFAEVFYKPKSNGENGHEVKKVKIYKKSTLNVSVHGGKGIADNGSMVRIDIFKIKNDGFYAIPIYISDTVKKELPNKAVVAYKPYETWKEMKEDDFIFSLYPRDLVKIKAKKELPFSRTNDKNSNSRLAVKTSDNDCLVYYVSFNILTGAIGVLNHDGTYKIDGMGIKTLVNLEKYQVDVLGNVSKVNLPEKRMRFR